MLLLLGIMPAIQAHTQTHKPGTARLVNKHVAHPGATGATYKLRTTVWGKTQILLPYRRAGSPVHVCTRHLSRAACCCHAHASGSHKSILEAAVVPYYQHPQGPKLQHTHTGAHKHTYPGSSMAQQQGNTHPGPTRSQATGPLWDLDPQPLVQRRCPQEATCPFSWARVPQQTHAPPAEQQDGKNSHNSPKGENRQPLPHKHTQSAPTGSNTSACRENCWPPAGVRSSDNTPAVGTDPRWAAAMAQDTLQGTPS